MWASLNRISTSTKAAVLVLNICLLCSSALVAQDRDAYRGVPEELTLPVGATITGELSQYLSSHQNRRGDSFSMTLTQPLIVNGWVVARIGQTVYGQVTVANKGGTGKGPSELGVELTELTLADGQQLPITTQLVESTGGSNTGRNIATVATTTGLGAAIGAAVGEGKGAGIGAAAGAYAGLIGVLLSSGKPAVITPESIVSFRLAAPSTFSTYGSERAFLPVSPGDYRESAERVRHSPPPEPPRYARVYTTPPPYVIAPHITIVRPYRRPVRVYRYGHR